MFLFCTFVAHAQMHVHVRAFNSGRCELEQAQVGKPFRLEISVEESDGAISEPEIEGIESFYVSSSGYHMQNINGRTTIVYNYTIRIDKKGSFSIGPVTVEDEKTIAKSDLLLLKVGEKELLHSVARSEQEDDKKIFLTIKADTQKVVVGQKVEGTMTFYCSRPRVSLLAVVDPDVDGFVRLEKEHPKQGVTKINGKQYSYVQWRWKFFPSQSGELIFPLCSADISRQSNDNFFSGFGFLHPRIEKKRLYSNALTMFVDPLPQHKKTVDAVGEFRELTIRLNQAVAKEGDGIVVKLSLEGDGDLENLFLDLQDMPHTFKSYRSKQYIEPLERETEFRKKTFEFIVQGMEKGEWEIPKQTFTYYSVEGKEYETLMTGPQLVKILQSGLTKQYVPPSIDVGSSIAVNTDVLVEDDSIALNEYGNWYKTSKRKMPFWLFVLLVFAPVGIWLSRFLHRLIAGYNSWRSPKREWKNAFKIARQKLKRGERLRDVAAPYRIFVELFSRRCAVKDTEVSDCMTQEILKTGGLTEQQMVEWEKFFATASAFVFYSVQGKQEEQNLFDQAEKWIKVLEEIL